MEITKALIAVGDEVQHCDVIEYLGGLWLVPTWIDTPTEGVQSPARIIRMDTLRHQTTAPSGFAAQYTLNDPMPKDVLDGLTTQSEGRKFEVVEAPPIQISRSDRGLH